jgi:hypothetical protein
MDKHEAKISLVGPRDRKIDILKWIFMEYGRKVTNGFIWLRRTNSELLWTNYWIFGLHTMQGIPQLASGIPASQEGPCFTKLVLSVTVYVS